MKKVGFKRIIALVLALVMITGMLQSIASAHAKEGQAIQDDCLTYDMTDVYETASVQSSGVHAVQNDGVTYDLPKLPTISRNYILLKNTTSKDVLLLVGLEDGYFGSDMKNVLNYNFSYQTTNFNPYVSTFDGTAYSYWTATAGTPSFSLSEYEIVYKSKSMYPVSPSWETGHIFVTLPEGVSWDDQIIITYSNGAYRLFQPTNNIGIWVDANNTNCDFVYRDTLTSVDNQIYCYTYDTITRTWTKGISERTHGNPNEIFYVGSDVFFSSGAVERTGQRDFYVQSEKPQEDDPIYDLASLLTSDSYIILRNTVSKNLTLLIGEDDGYFGRTTSIIWNYDSSYNMKNFTASYVSKFDGEKYGAWENNNIGNSFNLAEQDIIRKSKPMYPASPSWTKGHLFAVLPEGVSWDDKIIITYSNGAYRLYQPKSNDGVWVDAANKNCDFVYRTTLTAKNQEIYSYTYKTATRTWIKETNTRSHGTPSETFYVSSDVFSTNGTVKREGQRKLYVQSSKATGLQFEPLTDKETKDLLSFIANAPSTAVEIALPRYYDLLTGKIYDTNEELETRVLFMTYLYYCLDMQLSQCGERINYGASHLLRWLKDNEGTDIVEQIMDKAPEFLWDNLVSTIIKDIDAPEMFVGLEDDVNIAAAVMDYGELLVHSVGSLLAIKRINEVRYLKAYLELLEAEYNNDTINVVLCQFKCENVIEYSTVKFDPQEIQKYAEQIFSIEHSISIDFL